MWQRRLLAPVLEDLESKMCWVAGPRQCGKTTLSQQIIEKLGGHYYNWDDLNDQILLRKAQLDPDAKLWVIDEIHKFRAWRNLVKGLYDKNRSKKKILVTGSARLEIFSRGGDSLQGRYFLHRMHPLTLTEMLSVTPQDVFDFKNINGAKEALKSLFQFSGFPEPLYAQNERSAKRWRLNYEKGLFRDDVRDLDLVKDLDGIALLFDQLPEVVGSILSINSLREDLQKNFATVKNWLSILDNLYASFRISPFGSSKIKAVKKEQKLYLWDWGRVSDAGARFENLIALHLLRLTHWMEDTEGKQAELRFVRDETGKEVDFVVISDKKHLFLVECKSKDQEIGKNLKYFLERLPIKKAFQVSLDGTKDYEVHLPGEKTIRVIPAHKFLSIVP